MYGILNCNTVKKAQNWLHEHKLDFEFHDFKKKGVSDEELDKWFAAFGWEKVLNRSGLTFKKLTKEEQSAIQSPEKARLYLRQNTSAIKRPIVEIDGKPCLIAFDEEAYAELLK